MAIQNKDMKKIKILFIVPSLSSGGSERFIYTLSKYISKSKFSVSVFVINSKSSFYQYTSEDEVNLIEGNIERVRYSIFEVIKLTNKLKPEIIFSTLGYLNI